MLFLYFSPFISARLFYNVIPLTCYYWSLFSSGISNMGHQHCKQRHLESSLYYITLYYTKVIYSKYSKHWLILWHCVCSKLLNHGLNREANISWTKGVTPRGHFWWHLVDTFVHEKSSFWVTFRGLFWVTFHGHFFGEFLWPFIKQLTNPNLT